MPIPNYEFEYFRDLTFYTDDNVDYVLVVAHESDAGEDALGIGRRSERYKEFAFWLEAAADEKLWKSLELAYVKRDS